MQKTPKFTVGTILTSTDFTAAFYDGYNIVVTDEL